MRREKFCVLAFLFFSFADSVLSADWWYTENNPDWYGPSQWGKVSPFCDGRRQSPININTAVYAHSFHHLRYQNMYRKPDSTTVRNDGHGFAMSLNFNDGTKVAISGGPLGNDTYFLHDFHIHWGSEHTLNGKVFDAELHLVHYNARYPDIGTALGKSDGIAVMGIFMELDQSTDQIRPVVESAMRVREYGTPKYNEIRRENVFSLYDLIQRNKFKVWSYLGSLTTPKCNEVVTWMVSRNTIPIYKSELRLLKTMTNERGAAVDQNRRPTQPLNGRIIKQY